MLRVLAGIHKMNPSQTFQRKQVTHTKTHVGMTTIFVILLHVWRLLPDLRLRELAGVFELVET